MDYTKDYIQEQKEKYKYRKLLIFRNTPSCSDCGTRRLASTCGNAPLNTTPSSGDHDYDDENDDDDNDNGGYDNDEC